MKILFEADDLSFCNYSSFSKIARRTLWTRKRFKDQEYSLETLHKIIIEIYFPFRSYRNLYAPKRIWNLREFSVEFCNLNSFHPDFISGRCPFKQDNFNTASKLTNLTILNKWYVFTYFSNKDKMCQILLWVEMYSTLVSCKVVIWTNRLCTWWSLSCLTLSLLAVPCIHFPKLQTGWNLEPITLVKFKNTTVTAPR